MKNPLSVALIVFLSLFALAFRPVELRDFADSTRIVQIEFRSDHGSRKWTLSDRTVVIEHFIVNEISPGKYGHNLRQQRRTDATAKAAVETWSKIATLEIEKWKSEYKDPALRVSHESRWAVYLRDRGKVVRCSGVDVYPAIDPLGTPTYSLGPLGRIYTACDRLIEIIEVLEKEG